MYNLGWFFRRNLKLNGRCHGTIRHRVGRAATPPSLPVAPDIPACEGDRPPLAPRSPQPLLPRLSEIRPFTPLGLSGLFIFSIPRYAAMVPYGAAYPSEAPCRRPISAPSSRPGRPRGPMDQAPAPPRRVFRTGVPPRRGRGAVGADRCATVAYPLHSRATVARWRRGSLARRCRARAATGKGAGRRAAPRPLLINCSIGEVTHVTVPLVTPCRWRVSPGPPGPAGPRPGHRRAGSPRSWKPVRPRPRRWRPPRPRCLPRRRS